MKKLIIDRFENDYAVCLLEDKTTISIKTSALPPQIKEGDTIQTNDGITYFINESDTEKRAERIRKKINSLWKE